MNSRALVFQSDVTSAVCGSTSTSTIQEQDAVPIADVASSLLSRGLSELELSGLEGLPLVQFTPIVVNLPDLSLKADPPSLAPYIDFYKTFEDVYSLSGSTSRGPGTTSEEGSASLGLQLSGVSAASPTSLSWGMQPLFATPMFGPPSPPSPSASPSPSSSASPLGEVDHEPDHSGYVSPPRTAPPTARRKKRAARRHVPYPSPSPPSSPSSSDSSSSSSSSLSPEFSSTLRLQISPRRNVQVRASAPMPSASSSPALAPSSPSRSSSQRPCKHCNQIFPRMKGKELERHEDSHEGEEKALHWVCTGVPILRASEYGLTDHVQKYITAGRVMLYEGQYMVGGCGKSLCRPDALARHLRKPKGCIGSHTADWLLGNKFKKQ